MYTKRIITVIISMLICFSIIPIPNTLAAERSVIPDYSFDEASSALIGWDAFPITFYSDGSYEYGKDSEALKVGPAEALYGATLTADSIYPAVTLTFEKDDLAYTVYRFASLSSELGDIVIYSRLTVKNIGKKDCAFPSLPEGEVAISPLPTQIKKGKSAKCDLARTLKMSADLPEGYMTFEDAQSYMQDHWDSLLSDIMTFSDKSEGTATLESAYRSDIILSIIDPGSRTLAAFASPIYAKSVLLRGEDLYGCAIALMKTNDTETALLSLPKMQEKKNAIIDSLTSFDFYPGALLIMRDGKVHLEDNLEALNQLWGYSYVLSALCETDNTYSEENYEVSKSAEKLAGDIYSLINDATRKLSTDWETGSLSGEKTLVLRGEGFESASALCSWYVENAPFPKAVSSELYSLAVNAMDYYTAHKSPIAAINSYICERDDSTVIIGRTSPVSSLYDKAEIEVDNYTLSSGEALSYSVTVSKKTVTVTIDTQAAIPIQLEFSAFKENIESASCGFDIHSGIVTAPAGTSKITVTLIERAENVQEAISAATSLESTLAHAYNASTEGCTSVSAAEFDNAFAQAKKARSADTEEKLSATKKLKSALATLSPTVAGYDYSTVRKNAPLAGELTKSEICQRFTLPKKGTVTSLFISGDWSDSITCAVYTLRGDAYTKDVLLCEAVGKKADGGIVFDLDFKADEGETYILSVFCEYGEPTLNLYESAEEFAYSQAEEETTLYMNSALSLRFRVDQVDRSELDAYYNACLVKDVSDFTKESRNRFNSNIEKVKEHLLTPSVTEDEYKVVYEKLKGAEANLDTYASEDTVEEFPLTSIVLICVVAVLLAGTFVSAILAQKKSNQ